MITFRCALLRFSSPLDEYLHKYEILCNSLNDKHSSPLKLVQHSSEQPFRRILFNPLMQSEEFLQMNTLLNDIKSLWKETQANENFIPRITLNCLTFSRAHSFENLSLMSQIIFFWINFSALRTVQDHQAESLNDYQVTSFCFHSSMKHPKRFQNENLWTNCRNVVAPNPLSIKLYDF